MAGGGGFWDNLVENMGKTNTMAGPYVGPLNSLVTPQKKN